MPRLARRLAAVAAAIAGACGAAPLAASPAHAAAANPQTLWACRPDATPNPCTGPLTTTYLASTTLQPRRVAKVETPPTDAVRPVDCFYVYPTVSSVARTNAPLSLTREVGAILQYQAARFSQVCNVYAPVYRQTTLLGLVEPALGAPPKPGQIAPTLALAYGDVRRAWEDYLEHDNHGRGVVLIGHSQGSGHLIKLMQDRIDPDPELRARLVSAILPGGNLIVRQGERLGGDFEHVPLCAAATETGCAMAWSTFAYSPPADTYFGITDSQLREAGGLPAKPGTEVACVNPAVLSGDGGRMETFVRRETFPGLIGVALWAMYYGLKPYAPTPWISPGERYRGTCRHLRGDAHVLLLRPANAATILPMQAPWPEWGLHLADINLPLGNLIRVVRQQIAAYTAAHPGG